MVFKMVSIANDVLNMLRECTALSYDFPGVFLLSPMLRYESYAHVRDSAMHKRK